MTTATATFQKAFDAFMDQAFEDSVVQSTQASWGGGSYSVELFEDGTYRVQPTGAFGNLYDTPGVILRIPYLSEEEYSDDGDHFLDNVELEIRDTFSEI